MEDFRRHWKKCIGIIGRIYRNYGLFHIIRPSLLVAYTFIGAGIFLFFEQQAEIERTHNRTGHTQEIRDRAVRHMLTEVFNETQRFLLFVDGRQTNEIEQIFAGTLTDFESSIKIHSVKGEGNPKMRWDLKNALIYSWTVVTTIGYGHLCPATVGGRIATMVYAIFGIPLMLSVLTEVGKLLTKFMKYPFLMAKMAGRRLFQYCTKMTREEILEADTKDKSTLEVFDLPIPVAIGIIMVWIFICSAISLIWEKEWDYLEAFYFFFISLTTIGFGDVVPSDSGNLLVLFGNIMIGLALVSMCINLMQSKLEKINAAALAAALAENSSEDKPLADFHDSPEDRIRWRGVGNLDLLSDHDITDEKTPLNFVSTLKQSHPMASIRKIVSKISRHTFPGSDSNVLATKSHEVEPADDKEASKAKAARISMSDDSSEEEVEEGVQTESDAYTVTGEEDSNIAEAQLDLNTRAKILRTELDVLASKEKKKREQNAEETTALRGDNYETTINYKAVLNTQELLAQILHENNLPSVGLMALEDNFQV